VSSICFSFSLPNSPKAQDMMLVNNPLIVHTDVPDMIRELRRGKESITRIIEYSSVTALPLYSKYGKKVWEEQVELDEEKEVHKHSYNLHLVWNSKTDFLKQAVDTSDWHSSYFLWVDIGCMQFGPAVGDPRYEIEFTAWPDESALLQIPDDRMVFMAVGMEGAEPLNEVAGLQGEVDRMTSMARHLKGWDNISKVVWRMCGQRKEGMLWGLSNEAFMGGGIFGGHKLAVLRYHELYYKVLDKMLVPSLGDACSAADDQTVHAATVMLDPGILWLVPYPKYMATKRAETTGFISGYGSPPHNRLSLRSGSTKWGADMAEGSQQRSRGRCRYSGAAAGCFRHCNLPESDCDATRIAVFQPGQWDSSYISCSLDLYKRCTATVAYARGAPRRGGVGGGG
jgi:hypothetical protein